MTPRLNQVSGVRAGVSCEQINLAELPVDFERLFNVTTSLRRPRGLRARLHSPRPKAPNPRKPPNPSKGRRPPGSGWAARFFCLPHHFSGARVKRGPRPWRDRLGGLAGPIVFPPRRSDRRIRLSVDPQRADLDAGA